MFASKDVSIGLRAAYPIARSVRLRASATAYLSRTPASASNRTTWTWSSWVKFGLLTGSQTLFEAQNGTTFSRIVIDGNLNLSCQGGTSNVSTTFNVATSAVIRDPSSWYHLVISFDTTQATAANRVLVYINGVQMTAFATATYPTQNSTWSWNAACLHNIGRYVDSTFGAGGYADGYLAEMNFVDGQALTPSSFGAFNIYGIWQPAKYQGTYGTNGFYLKFDSYATAAALGTDSSGNSNTWTVNNINVTAYSGSPPNNTSYDSMTDVPTLTNASVANYPTLNPTAIYSAGNTITASNGNLTFNQATCTANTGMGSSFLVPTGAGLFYYEITQQTKTTVGGDQTQPFVLSVVKTANGTSPSNAFYYWAGGGNTGDPAGATLTGVNGTSIANSDVIMVAIDLAAGKLYLGKNGTWLNSAVPASGTGACATNLLNYATISPAVGNGGGNMTNFTCSINFGQRPFTYTPPSGFVALNTYNLSTPAIPNGAAYMAATTYTGTGAVQSITNTVNGTALQPDWIWIKRRSAVENHWLVDVVRGVTEGLSSNSTAATVTRTDQTTAFNSNGFALGVDVAGYTNISGQTYVGWQWKANGTGVSNTSGSISSTVSAGATQGFSVVTYTGTGANATVGHGLGVAPSMVIVKSRSSGVFNWSVYHIATGATGLLILQTTNAFVTSSTTWNNTAPTSSLFSIGTDNGTNASAGTYVAYCFAAVAGYSAFGSYTGNGSADGPFVYLGFRPRFTLIKRTDAIANWRIHDTARDTYNVASKTLYPNLTNAETSAASEYWDILSNGIKLRTSDAESNASGGTYIYMALAENPFKYALAR